MIDAPAVGRMELERLLVLSMLQPNTVRTRNKCKNSVDSDQITFLVFSESLNFYYSASCVLR